MNDRIAARAARWNSRSATAGRMLRSRPTIAPTKALTTTRRVNCARFGPNPSRTEALMASPRARHGLWGMRKHAVGTGTRVSRLDPRCDDDSVIEGDLAPKAPPELLPGTLEEVLP